MPRVGFYLVTTAQTPGELDSVLPKLLEKVLESGQRAVVRCPTAERAERLNDWLWSYDAASFLPHGLAKDAHADLQPIIVTHEAINPNGASIMLRLAGATADDYNDFERVLEIFGGTEEGRAAARERWKFYREQNITLSHHTYEDGRWKTAQS